MVRTQSSDFRARRSHEKSRNGCTRCKQQRKKCDELRPACSRCSNRAYCCKYDRASQPERHSSEERRSTDMSRNYVRNSPPTIIVSPTSGSPAVPDNRRSVAGSSPHSTCSYAPSFIESEGQQPSQIQTPNTLNATELSLLSHYLTHTSHSIPFDDGDFYALSVGIPNLAFSSMPVMSSLLALAAACKCHQILQQRPAPLESLQAIFDLLNLADRHHRAALEQIQAAILNPNQYSHLLANAALMVLYCSASHRVRIHLAESAKASNMHLPSEVLPVRGQWISPIRAAHTASIAVLNSPMGNNHVATVDLPSSSSAEFSSPIPSRTSAFPPQDGPSESTKRFFLPIVTSTYRRALDSIFGRARHLTGCVDWLESSASHDSKFQTCLESLTILQKVASETLSPTECDLEIDTGSMLFDRLANVPPWLGRYLARVTSITTPKPLRRSIMSFLNLVPLEFLDTIMSVLDSVSLDSGDTASSPLEGARKDILTLSTADVLAMDIFAHWLVFVMLLDGVWWIGGIGQWELEQAVSLMKSQVWFDTLIDQGETWWPESMYLVKRELVQHL